MKKPSALDPPPLRTILASLVLPPRLKFVTITPLWAALHEPGLNTDVGQFSVEFYVYPSLGWVDFHFPTSCARARTLNRKKSDVRTSPGQMGQCLHEEIEEISTLLVGST